MPYWDWSRYSGTPFKAPVWNDTVLGGDGDIANSYCVVDGPFNSSEWSVRPNGTCLMRQFGNTLPTMVAVNLALAISPQNFSQFEIAMRGTMHGEAMCSVGRTMCSNLASNAPEFWLFNAYVDSLWRRWQIKSLAHADAFFPSVTEQLSGTNGLVPRDLTNSSKLPGGVCVTYQWPLSPVNGPSTTSPPPATTSPAATTTAGVEIGEGIGPEIGEELGSIPPEPEGAATDLMETEASEMTKTQLANSKQIPPPTTTTTPRWVALFGMNTTEYQFWQRVNAYLSPAGSSGLMTSLASQQAGVSLQQNQGQSGSSGGASGGTSGSQSSVEQVEENELMDILFQ